MQKLAFAAAAAAASASWFFFVKKKEFSGCFFYCCCCQHSDQKCFSNIASFFHLNGTHRNSGSHSSSIGSGVLCVCGSSVFFQFCIHAASAAKTNIIRLFAAITTTDSSSSQSTLSIVVIIKKKTKILTARKKQFILSALSFSLSLVIN